MDGGGRVGIGAVQDEAARVGLHQDIAREGVGPRKTQGAEAGLGDAAHAAEGAGHDRVDGGGAIIDLKDADGTGVAAEGDRVGEGQRARGVRGGEDQGRGVRQETAGTPGQRGARAAEVDGTVGADGRETTRTGELDLAGGRADRPQEVAGGELDRAAREVEVIQAAGGADAARQGVGGREAEGARVDARLAGVEVGAGEREDAEAVLRQATRAGEDAGERGVDRRRAVGDVDGALGGAEVDRVGEGDVVGGSDVGQQQRRAGGDEAARAPVQHDAGRAEIDGAVGVERVEAGGAGELRLVGGGAEGAGEITEAQAQLARGERDVARATDPVRAARQGQLGGQDQVAAVEERGAGEDVGARQRQGFGAVLHEAARAGHVDVDHAGLGGDLRGEQRAAGQAAAVDEEVIGGDEAVEVEDAAGDGDRAGAEGRGVAEGERARGDGGAAGVGVGGVEAPATRPTLRQGDRRARRVAEGRVEDRDARVGAREDEGAGARAGKGDVAGAGEGQGVRGDRGRDIDHAALGPQGEEAVGRGGHAGVEQVAAVEDEVAGVAGRGADRADGPAVGEVRDREDAPLDEGPAGVIVEEVAEHQGAEAGLDEVGRAGDHASHGQGHCRDDDVDVVLDVTRQGHDAIEREVVVAAEGEPALELDGVAQRVRRQAGKQEGTIPEHELARAGRAGHERTAGDGRVVVDVQTGTGVDAQFAGEDALAAEREDAAAGDRDRHLEHGDRVVVAEQGRDVEGRLPGREGLPVQGDRADVDGRRGGTAELEGAGAADRRDLRGVLAGGEERAGQGQLARADVDGGRVGRERGQQRGIAAVVVERQAGELVVARERQGRLRVEDDAVGRVDLAGGLHGQVRRVEGDGGVRGDAETVGRAADVRGRERLAQGDQLVRRVGGGVDRGDDRAGGDADARDLLTDLEGGGVGDGDRVGAREAAVLDHVVEDGRLGRASRDDVTGAAEEHVALVEDEAAGIGVGGTRERRGVIGEVSRVRGVRVVEDQADRPRAVVDHVGADGELAAGGGGGRVAELVDVEVAADAGGARGQATVAEGIVGTIAVLADHQAARRQGQDLAVQVDGAGGGAALVEAQGVDRAVTREEHALVLEVDVVRGERGRQVRRSGRVDREAGATEVADAHAVHVGGEIALAVGPAADDAVDQRRRGLELEAGGVADLRKRAVEVDDGRRAGGTEQRLGDQVGGVDVDAGPGLQGGPDVVGTLDQDDATNLLDGRGVGLVREVELAPAKVDVDVVRQAVRHLVITMVLEGQLAVVDVDAGDAGERPVILDEDRAAVDGEAAGEGVRVDEDDAARARLDEVDRAGDHAAVTQGPGVGLVDDEVGGAGARDIAGGTRDIQGAGTHQGQEGLGVAAEVEGRARVDDHRGRHRQRVGPAVEGHGAVLDRGPARRAGELLGVEVQGAAEVLVPAVRRVEGGPVEVQRGARSDQEARDGRTRVDDHPGADRGIARGEQHAGAGKVEGLEAGEGADRGVGQLEGVDLGEAGQLGVGRLVEERRGARAIERAGGDVVGVAVDAGRGGKDARGRVTGEVRALRVGDDRAGQDVVRQGGRGGEEDPVLLRAERVTTLVGGEEGEIIGIAGEPLEDEGGTRRGGVDADDGVAGGRSQVVRQVILGGEGARIAGVSQGAALEHEGAVGAEAAGDRLQGVVQPDGAALEGGEAGAVGAADHAAVGNLPGAGVVLEALLADPEEAVRRLDVEGAGTEVLGLVVVEGAAVGGVEALAGDGDVAGAARLEDSARGHVDATGENQVAGDGPDRGIVVDGHDAGHRVRAGDVGQVAGELDAPRDHVAGRGDVEVLGKGDAPGELEGRVDAAGDVNGVVARAERGGVGGHDHALLDLEGALPVGIRRRKDQGADVLLGEGGRRAAGEGAVQGQRLAREHLDPGIAHEADRTVGRPGIHRAETRPAGGGKDDLVGRVAQGGVRGGGDEASRIRDEVAPEGIAGIRQDDGALRVLDDIARTRDQT